MTTPTRNPLWAMFALLAGLLWLAARTTLGLTLVTVGSLAAFLGHPWTGLAVAALGVMVYAQQCSRSPYARCLRCHGSGHHPKRRGRDCRPCRGKGVRMRWGRAVMNTYRRATYTGAAPAAPAARPPAAGTYAQALRDTNKHDAGTP